MAWHFKDRPKSRLAPIHTNRYRTFTAIVGPTEVPEPATVFLFGSGIAAMAARRRARR